MFDPKVQFVWLVWALHTVSRHGTLCRPWRGWRRWASARYGWTCTGTARRLRCDCLWRVHFKIRQITAHRVWIKSSGKIHDWVADTREQFKNFITRWKKLRLSIWKYGSHSVDHEVQACTGPVRLEQCEGRMGGREEGGQSCFGTERNSKAESECEPKVFSHLPCLVQLNKNLVCGPKHRDQFEEVLSRLQTNSGTFSLWYEGDPILICPNCRRIAHFWTKPAPIASRVGLYALRTTM